LEIPEYEVAQLGLALKSLLIVQEHLGSLPFFKSEDLKKIKKVGEGSQGDVYLCKLVKSGRHVVVKKMREDGWDELKAMRAIPKHKNLLELIGVMGAKEKSTICIVTDFCRHGSLDSLHDRFDLREEKKFRQIATDILSGLSCLHEQNVLHRDISCRNCLMKEDGSVLISDYGLAVKTSYQEEKKGRKGHLSKRGTTAWSWQSPEFLSSKLFTEECDIWSLGVLFWEIMVRGAKTPDEEYARLAGSNNRMKIITKIVSGKIRLDIFPGCRNQLLRELTDTCLKFDKRERYPARGLLQWLCEGKKPDISHFLQPEIEDREFGKPSILRQASLQNYSPAELKNVTAFDVLITMKNVMTPVERVRSVHPSDSVLSASETMLRYRLPTLPVLDEDKKFKGVIDEIDLLKFELKDTSKILLTNRNVSDVMFPAAKCASLSPRSTFKEICIKLTTYALHVLPVLDDDDRLIGIVTTTMILDRMHRVLKAKSNERPNGHYWVPCEGRMKTPKDAVAGGKDVDGNTLYVARAKVDGSLVPGKANPAWRHCCVSSSRGELQKKVYEVLCSGEAKLEWVDINKAASEGGMPDNAVVGGSTRDCKPLFIMKAKHTRDYQCGYCIGPKVGVYSFGGKVLRKKDFEILIVNEGVDFTKLLKHDDPKPAEGKDRPMPVVLGSHNFALTKAKVNEKDNWDQVVRNEYGTQATVAEWEVLSSEANRESKWRFRNFLQKIGLRSRLDTAVMLANGRKHDEGNRVCYVQRHDGKLPDGWGKNDSIHDDTLSKGSSLVMTSKILVDLGPV